MIFQWIGLVEYILGYGGPAEHWDPLPATRLASRKILIQQNIKKRAGSSLCVLCVCTGRGAHRVLSHAVNVNSLWIERWGGAVKKQERANCMEPLDGYLPQLSGFYSDPVWSGLGGLGLVFKEL